MVPSCWRKFSTTTGEMFINGVGQGAAIANYVLLTVWDGGGIDAYDFTNYTNLGQVVTRGKGRVEESDLSLLDKKANATGDPNQTEYVQRIIWTGQTEKGQAVGTGAYVLKAVFQYDRNFKTGAKPSTSTKITKFGFLRTCCESFNRKWYY